MPADEPLETAIGFIRRLSGNPHHGITECFCLDEREADQAAVDAMRRALNSLDIDGEVVIGEGERDQAPMLFIGETVGTGDGPAIDIALDPLEGTTITAKGGPNAMAVISMANKGGFLRAPDVYMDKIAVGGGLPDDIVNLDAPPAENLKALAKAKDSDVYVHASCNNEEPLGCRGLLPDLRSWRVLKGGD